MAHALMLLALQLALAQVPNPAVTPGALALRHGKPLTWAVVCHTKWGLDRRHVTDRDRRQIAANYGLTMADVTGKGLCCEYDHLIPRSLGGADKVENQWVQPWATARLKDLEENRLSRAVCVTRTLTLVDAQERMRRWGR